MVAWVVLACCALGAWAAGKAEQAAPAAKGKALVVYFSRTGEQYGVGVIDKGNTEIVADLIVEATGADRFELEPVDDRYPRTYRELTEVAKREQERQDRPAYRGEAPDLSAYDTIFLGAPVWWGDWPMIVYTFLDAERDALAGKTIAPFSTHAGSGLGRFSRSLAETCPSCTVAEGLAVRGTDAQGDRAKVKRSVDGWLAGLGY